MYWSRTYSNAIFKNAFTRKFYEQMVTFIQVKARNFPQNKLVNSVETNFVFAGLKLIVFVQNKVPEICIFMVDLFKTRGITHLNVQCWDLVVVCPPDQNFWLCAWSDWHHSSRTLASWEWDISYLFEYKAQNCIPKTPTQSSVCVINQFLDFYTFTPEGTWVQVCMINKSYARERASTVYFV